MIKSGVAFLFAFLAFTGAQAQRAMPLHPPKAATPAPSPKPAPPVAKPA